MQPKSAVPPAPAPNTPLGHFILVDRIAVGGMAEVFRALEPRTAGEPRVVVLKRMLPEMARDREAVRLFQQEAELGLQIDHPNVVHVLNAGELQGSFYLTLEYVPGCDLWRLQRMLAQRNQQLPLELNIHIARSLLAGLSAIHNARSAQGEELSVVHNDVSPSNILISVHGEVKLTDLGIAHAQTHHADEQQTRAQKKGKLGYMAPELITDEARDHRADIFSAGVVIAELLMRRPLFSAGSELAILLAIRDGDIQPFLDVADHFPKDLSGAVLKALATQPKQRWSSAQEFADALAPWDTIEKISARNELARIVTEVRLQLDNGLQVRNSLPGMQDSDNSLPPTSSLLDHHMPTTADVEPLEYHVRTSDGSTLGPFTYAKIVEKIAVGSIAIEDQISIGKSSFRPVGSYTDLVRHMSLAQQNVDNKGRVAQFVSKSSATFDDGGFVRALLDSVIAKRTGLWLCEFGDMRKEVYLHRGAPTFVTSNMASELLGEYLVNKKVIGREELDMALAVMPRFEGKLGDTLVELGLVEPVQLFRHIGEQIRDKLVDLFTWQRGSAAFYENINPPLSEFPLNLDAWKLLDAGMASRIRTGLENGLMLQRAEHEIEVEQTTVGRCDLTSLPADALAIIDLCKKPITLDALVAKMEERDPSDPQKPYRTIALLLYGNVLHWVD